MEKLQLAKRIVCGIAFGIAVFVLTAAPVFAAPPTLTFNANPTSVSQGQAVSLSWNASNASYCVASGGWSGYLQTYGSAWDAPRQTTEYAIVCTGPEGSASQRVTVSVSVPTTVTPVSTTGTGSGIAGVTATLNAVPESVASGEAATLAWSSSGASTCIASGGIWSGTKLLSGTERVTPAVNTTYSLVCTNASGGSASANKTVLVNRAPAPIPASFAASCVTSPSTIRVGDRVTFAGGASGGTGQTTFSWTGDVSGSGAAKTATFTSTGTKSATVTARDEAGRSASATCRVAVNPAAAATQPTRTVASIALAPKAPEVDPTEKLCLENGFVKAGESAKTGDSEKGLAAALASLERNSFLFAAVIIILSVAATAFTVFTIMKKAEERKNQNSLVGIKI